MAYLSFTSFKLIQPIANTPIETIIQEGLIVFATYDGKEDYGYNFITKANDDEHTLTFQEVEGSVLSVFDLNADTFVGAKFKITFKREIKILKDENNMDDENEINTITKLEKL